MTVAPEIFQVPPLSYALADGQPHRDGDVARPVEPPTVQLVEDDVVGQAFEREIARAEQLIARHEYSEAVAALRDVRPSPATLPELALRGLLAESWARMSLGQLTEAVTVLERAQALAKSDSFAPEDRAEALYRLGCCRFLQASTASAVSLFTVALELCDRSRARSERLRARILDWRSRCYQRQRDWGAARQDVERGLEAAERAGDDHTAAYLYFQASIVAEREHQWLTARTYAEYALALYERFGDRLNMHKVLNNLGGIHFLLDDRERAVASLKESFRIALELGSDVGAAYAMSSLAQIQLRADEPAEAEAHGLRALELLAGRADHLNEIGNTQLVVGRALLAQERWDDAGTALATAEATYRQLGATSETAAVWMAQGDLAARRGDCERAAALYRRAAEALQDFHF